jgi:hypothetical protein
MGLSDEDRKALLKIAAIYARAIREDPEDLLNEAICRLLAGKAISRAPTRSGYRGSDFVPWRFSDASRRSPWMAPRCRHPRNLHRSTHASVFLGTG